MHMIIKFESFNDMCSKKLIWPKHSQNSTKRQKFESKQHLEALALVALLMLPTKLIAIKYGHNRISNLCGRLQLTLELLLYFSKHF